MYDVRAGRTPTVVCLLVLATSLGGCTSHSSKASATVSGPVGPSALVLEATLRPGAPYAGLTEAFIALPGVVATGYQAGKFTISLGTNATMKQYMALRDRLDATPGIEVIVERTSTGQVFATSRSGP
jgi:hypothetical protein